MKNKLKLMFNLTAKQKTRLLWLGREMEISVSELLRRIIDEWFDMQAKESDR